ncbi:HAD-IA family hydrolase [Kytococcus sp. Marseille-QA3725]
MPKPPAVRLLLLDADAVIQRMPDGWREEALAHLAVGWDTTGRVEDDPELWGRARAVLDEIFTAEVFLLTGQEADPDFADVIGEVLRGHGNTADPATTARLWHRTTPLAEERAMVAAARQEGLRVAMGTNQQPHRAAWLAESDAFADLADEVYTSSRLGVAKPEPDFFRAVLAAEAEAGFPVEPAQVVFVDDRQDNVDGALEAGLVARRYHFTQGAEAFGELLRSTGVLPG